jgi:hypothetical protein
MKLCMPQLCELGSSLSVVTRLGHSEDWRVSSPLHVDRPIQPLMGLVLRAWSRRAVSPSPSSSAEG